VFRAILILEMFAAAAVAPPELIELSPTPPAPMPVVSPESPVSVQVGKYRWFKVSGYAGPVTWEVDGAGMGFKECDKPLSLFGTVSGQAEPTFSEVPAGAVIVWGKTPGDVKLHAFGVVDGKAKRLFSKSFTVDGSAPQPPPPKPDDGKTEPVKGKLYGWVLIEETSRPFKNRGQSLVKAIEWSRANGVQHRVADQDVTTADGTTPADVAPYIARAKSKGVPQLYLVTETGAMLWEGAPPESATAWVELLNKYKGK